MGTLIDLVKSVLRNLGEDDAKAKRNYMIQLPRDFWKVQEDE